MDADVAHAEEVRIPDGVQKALHPRLRVWAGDRDAGNVRQKTFVERGGVKVRLGLRFVIQGSSP